MNGADPLARSRLAWRLPAKCIVISFLADTLMLQMAQKTSGFWLTMGVTAGAGVEAGTNDLPILKRPLRSTAGLVVLCEGKIIIKKTEILASTVLLTFESICHRFHSNRIHWDWRAP